ncbi:MAG: hypothetical protein ABGZ53_10760 [Fuerstiella sp.]
MKKTLVSWVGGHDFGAAADQSDGWGPVCNAVRDRDFDRIVLLSNYPKSKSDGFVAWLQEHTDAQIELSPVTLSRAARSAAATAGATATAEAQRILPFRESACFSECNVDRSNRDAHAEYPCRRYLWVRSGGELGETRRLDPVLYRFISVRVFHIVGTGSLLLPDHAAVRRSQ